MTRIALIALPLLLCAACTREEPVAAPAAETPAAATEPAPAAPASVAAPTTVEAPAPADPASTFDAGAFAGTFAGNDTRLELHADGSYGLEAPDGVSQGTWTHEASSDTIRLDPGSKTAQDRVFRLDGRDTLADGSVSLARQPAS